MRSLLAQVNVDKCRELAALIRGLPIPPDQEEADLNLSLIPASRRTDFLLSLVAICHQTTPVGGPKLEGTVAGAHRRGWDYLSNALLEAVIADNSLVSPTRLKGLTADQLLEIIRRPDITAEIKDIDGRARLLNDLGGLLVQAGMDSVEDLYTLSGGYLLREDSGGILQRLSVAKAYSDPVRKKSLYFCMLAKNQGLWRFRDEEHLSSPVDYHEIRGHLRIGTVRLDNSVLDHIRSAKVTADMDVAIRGAVASAIDEVATSTGLSAATLHYFFWNLFRSCCLREGAHCDSCPDDCTLPNRYRLGRSNLACSLSTCCESKTTLDKIVDYSLDTEFY
jgi:hypothetical protein